jgi:hypothetical protein
MELKKTGGQAFPSSDGQTAHAIAAAAITSISDSAERDRVYMEVHAQARQGMTLRDYFAAKCCAAMVSTIRDDRDYDRLREIADAHDLDSVSEFFAREAYKQADAMLAERAK